MYSSHTGKRQIAHVVDVNMGYGHARAAWALRDLCVGNIVTANDYKGIPHSDKRFWEQGRKVYEAISRLKPVPILGDLAFGIMDGFQEILPFYPRRDLSRPSIQLRQIYRMLKAGHGKHLIDTLAKNPLPLVTTFFSVAFMADYHGYPGEIYCVTTDADIARHWASLDPKHSKIKYFASNGRCKERLQLYGVPESQVFLTGFPLPKELIGGYPEKQVRIDLLTRICQLDPQGIFLSRYDKILRTRLQTALCPIKKTRPLTLAFSVGGAGAQKSLAEVVMKSLKRAIVDHKIRLALFAGIRKNVADSFLATARELGLLKEFGKHLLIVVEKDRPAYFEKFHAFLHETDILMTKPSEMSFYTALGIPIVMAPPIGSQEKFNSVWLQYVGGGVPMNDPRYMDEWLFDWINSGGLARMAWSGYVEAPTHGTYRIEDIVSGKKSEIHTLPMIV